MTLRAVYRIEDQHGLGPYNPPGDRTELSRSLDFAHSCTDTHPTPGMEGIMHYGEYAAGFWVSGFERMSHLKTWFEGFHERLTKNGYSVCKFLVDKEHVEYGTRQLTFVREKAVKMELLSCGKHYGLPAGRKCTKCSHSTLSHNLYQAGGTPAVALIGEQATPQQERWFKELNSCRH